MDKVSRQVGDQSELCPDAKMNWYNESPSSLKEHLIRRGLKVTGKRAELVARLIEFDASVTQAIAPILPSVPPPVESDGLKDFFINRIKPSSMDIAISRIEYVASEETISQKTLFSWSIMATSLSLVDLTVISPYVKRLYGNDDFWQYRYHIHSGGVFEPVIRPPPSPFKTWREYCHRLTNPVYVRSPDGKFRGVEQYAWRTLYNLIERRPADEVEYAPKELEITGQPNTFSVYSTRAYIGKTHSGLWLSFVNFPGSTLEYFADIINDDEKSMMVKHAPGISELRYIDTSLLTIDDYESPPSIPGPTDKVAEVKTELLTIIYQ